MPTATHEYSAVFWLEAETPESVMRSLHQIADALQLPERQAKEQAHMVTAVQRWLATHPRWLLIGDNIEDLDLLQPLLPALRQGTLLLTTRRQALGPLVKPLEVSPMSREEGATQLLRRAGLLLLSGHDSSSELRVETVSDPAILALVSFLEGLPLALDQAGAYIEETGCGVADYLERCRHQRKYVLARRGAHAGSHLASVATTLRLAVERIARAHPAAADLLRACAFLHPEAIPEELFTVGAAHLGPVLGAVVADPYQFDLALAALRSGSLVKRFPESRTLSVHRLVQAVLEDQMEPEEAHVWRERVVRAVNVAFPEVTFETWAQCERCLAHALACAPLIEGGGNDLPEAGELLHKTGSYLLERGRYREAEPLLKQALTLGEHQYGPEHQALIPLLMRRAELFWRQGKYEAAIPFVQRIVVIREQSLGPDHLESAEALNNLALLYWQQGKYAQAEPLYQRALRIREQYLGPEHLDTASTLNNLALLYGTQVKYEQAESLYQRVVCIEEQQLGSEHPRLANTLNNLAHLYYNQGEYKQAEPLYQRSLRLQEQHLGTEHPYTVRAQSNLAALYRDQGKYEQAEPLYQRILHLQEHNLEPDHPDVLQILFGLATLYRDQGKYEQAELLYLRILPLQEQQLGEEHLHTIATLNYLAQLYWQQGSYEQAEALYQRVMTISEQRAEADDAARVWLLGGLGRVYVAQGTYERAASLLQEAFTLAQDRLGASHPRTASCLSALGELYLEQGRKELAEAHLQQALAIFQEHLEPAHPERVRCQTILQQLYEKRFCQNSEDDLVWRPLMEYACEKQTSDEE